MQKYILFLSIGALTHSLLPLLMTANEELVKTFLQKYNDIGWFQYVHANHFPGLSYEKIIDLLLSHEAPIESKCLFKGTALHIATLQDNYEVVKLLLEAGANIEARDQFGKTPIFYATGKLLILFIEHGANLDAIALDKNSPKSWIDYQNKKESATLLSSYGT